MIAKTQPSRALMASTTWSPAYHSFTIKSKFKRFVIRLKGTFAAHITLLVRTKRKGTAVESKGQKHIVSRLFSINLQLLWSIQLHLYVVLRNVQRSCYSFLCKWAFQIYRHGHVIFFLRMQLVLLFCWTNKNLGTIYSSIYSFYNFTVLWLITEQKFDGGAVYESHW